MFSDACLGCLSTRDRDGNGPRVIVALRDSKFHWVHVNGDQRIQCACCQEVIIQAIRW